jgi:hypothetical protein
LSTALAASLPSQFPAEARGSRRHFDVWVEKRELTKIEDEGEKGVRR